MSFVTMLPEIPAGDVGLGLAVLTALVAPALFGFLLGRWSR